MKPRTRYAFCEQGLPVSCPKTGMENESVTRMSFVARSERLVTAKPLVPYEVVAYGTAPTVAVQSTVARRKGTLAST